MYKIISPRRIEMIGLGLREDYDPLQDPNERTPFENFPAEFSRRKISLKPITRDLQRLIARAGYCSSRKLTESEIGQLSKRLDLKMIGSCIDDFSQFGGEPRFWQGHWEICCPNQECEAHLPWRHDFSITRHEKKFMMKELAVVCEDSGLEMDMHCAQIAFHICWLCLTIHAEYRCD
jgi:hypothetical protein